MTLPGSDIRRARVSGGLALRARPPATVRVAIRRRIRVMSRAARARYVLGLRRSSVHPATVRLFNCRETARVTRPGVAGPHGTSASCSIRPLPLWTAADVGAPLAFDAAAAKSEAVSFTVLTTLLITLRALASGPPFFAGLRFFGEAFFAGAFFAAAFFAGAFFAAFFDGFLRRSLLRSGLLRGRFAASLLAEPSSPTPSSRRLSSSGLLRSGFFARTSSTDFLADFLRGLLCGLSWQPWILSYSKLVGWGAVRLKENLCCVATALHEFQCRRRCRDCHARNGFRDGLQRSRSSSSSSSKRSAIYLFILNRRLTRELVNHSWRAPTVIVSAAHQRADARGHAVRRRLAHHAAGHARSRFRATCRDAFLAAEDVRFHHHIGIDPIGMARALFTNIRAHGIAAGGSTIDQQIIKSRFLSQERTWRRKITEIVAGHAARRAHVEERDPRGLPQRRLPRAQRRQAGARHRRSVAPLLRQAPVGAARRRSGACSPA